MRLNPTETYLHLVIDVFLFYLHKVSLEVKDVAKGFSLLKLKDTYSSEKLKDETNGYYGFDVMFDHPELFALSKVKRMRLYHL